MKKKDRHNIPVKSVREVAALFSWFVVEQLVLWFFGKVFRNGTLERIVEHLVDDGELLTAKINIKGKLAYRLKRRKNEQVDYERIPHELMVTETKVRLRICDPSGEIIPARKFYHLGSVPEYAIRYKKAVLCVEVCREDNFNRRIKDKVYKYGRNLAKIEEKFDRMAVVLFVCDVPSIRLKRFVERMKPHEAFTFVSFDDFCSVAFKEQLYANIHFWWNGEEAVTQPLRDYEYDTTID